MKREFSAGGIVFNNQGQVLLVQTNSVRSKQQNGHEKYWGFPKGNLNAGEKSYEAALREVREEAGVEADILEKVGDSRYIYTLNGEKVFKVVTIFLMKYLSGETSDHDFETEAVDWFSPEEALEKLSFSQDKKLLQKAREMIKQRNR